tara:strand:+ start:448 stop:1677 length:1230 start_codon:yes stop_codon:yes gene_type:complete
MPNFGTYEGHRILSDAMDKAISETARQQEFKEKKRQFDVAQELDRDRYEENRRQFDESHGLDTDRFGLDQDRTYHGMHDKDRHFGVHSDKTYHGMGIDDRNMTNTEKNSAVSRKYTGEQIEGLEFENRGNEEEYQRAKLAEDIKRKAYDKRGLSNAITTTDANGNISFKPNASEIIKDWNKSFDMNSILAQDTDGILTDADRQEINSSMVNPGMDDMLNLKKAFADQPTGAIDSLLDNNPGLRQQILEHGINTGNPIQDGQTVGEYIKELDYSGTEKFDPMNTDESGGWGAEKHVEAFPEMDGWGGNIQFKGYGQANRQEKKDANILLEAMKASKDGEASRSIWSPWHVPEASRSDDMWLTQTKDGWTVGEDDFGHNDAYDARIEGGIAEVKVNGKWVPLAGMTSSDWE